MAKNKPTEPKLEFADEEPVAPSDSALSEAKDSAPETPPVAEMSYAERNELNQKAAVTAIEAMKRTDFAKAYPVQKPSLPEATPEEIARVTPKVYCVLEDRRVATATGTHVLRTGKVFNENQYNVADLKRQGVKLEEIKPSA